MSFDHFNIYRSDAFVGPFSLIGTSVTLIFTDSTAVVGHTYFYYGTAVDQYGIESEPSEIFTVVYSLTEPLQIISPSYLGTANYRYMTEILAEMQDLGDEALPPLLCVRDQLFLAEINPRERYRREFFAMLDNTYSFIALNHTVPDSTIISMVQSLTNHILRNYGNIYGYETLDEFLSGQYLEVPQTFADICRYIGIKVSEVGDKAANWEDIDNNWEDIYVDINLIGWENL